MEVSRPGPSFTIDTVTALAAKHPDWELFLVAGLDALRDLPTWYQAEALARKVGLLACYRPPLEPEPVVQSLPVAFRRGLQLVRLPQVEVSATLIRERIAAGQPYAAFVHPAVYNHIESQGLYRVERR